MIAVYKIIKNRTLYARLKLNLFALWESQQIESLKCSRFKYLNSLSWWIDFKLNLLCEQLKSRLWLELKTVYERLNRMGPYWRFRTLKIYLRIQWLFNCSSIIILLHVREFFRKYYFEWVQKLPCSHA